MKRNSSAVTSIIISITALVGCQENISQPDNKQIIPISNESFAVFSPLFNTVTLLTKSGVVIKTVSLDKRDSIPTVKQFSDQIHKWNDTLNFFGEWIGDKLYWKVTTSGRNTRGSESIQLVSTHETPLINLCNKCKWDPVGTGTIDFYVTSGITSDVSIEIWNRVTSMSFMAQDK